MVVFACYFDSRLHSLLHFQFPICNCCDDSLLHLLLECRLHSCYHWSYTGGPGKNDVADFRSFLHIVYTFGSRLSDSLTILELGPDSPSSDFLNFRTSRINSTLKLSAVVFSFLLLTYDLLILLVLLFFCRLITIISMAELHCRPCICCPATSHAQTELAFNYSHRGCSTGCHYVYKLCSTVCHSAGIDHVRPDATLLTLLWVLFDRMPLYTSCARPYGPDAFLSMFSLNTSCISAAILNPNELFSICASRQG